ncbi:hypothetical protein [Reyranella sp.]|uniref:hypothetical protein n=1 Tax=Reyranella sp. TaxID=1929291 RepID=UPI00272F3A7C|nr:hypothetical protein [Reyranella sp.]MDP2378241.1 hypothetical protein [Reyranella sp.]
MACVGLIGGLGRRRQLGARKIRRVALFGTVFTVEGGLWGQLTGVDIVKPRPGEITFIGQA